LIVAALAWVGGARAHSTLRRSSPAHGARFSGPPEAFELEFDEPAQLTAFRLFAEGGAEIPVARDPSLPARAFHRIAAPRLGAGAYRIEWRVISADGHPVGGALRFAVEAGP
jgi:methionine-rich copper-binding protein CopC